MASKKKFHPNDFKVELIQPKKQKIWMRQVIESKTTTCVCTSLEICIYLFLIIIAAIAIIIFGVSTK